MGCGFSSSAENLHFRGSNISWPGMLDRARSAGSGSYLTGTWMELGSMGLGVSLEFGRPGRRSEDRCHSTGHIDRSNHHAPRSGSFWHTGGIQWGGGLWCMTQTQASSPGRELWCFICPDEHTLILYSRRGMHHSLQLSWFGLCYNQDCLQRLYINPVWPQIINNGTLLVGKKQRKLTGRMDRKRKRRCKFVTVLGCPSKHSKSFVPWAIIITWKFQ